MVDGSGHVSFKYDRAERILDIRLPEVYKKDGSGQSGQQNLLSVDLRQNRDGSNQIKSHNSSYQYGGGDKYMRAVVHNKSLFGGYSKPRVERQRIGPGDTPKYKEEVKGSNLHLELGKSLPTKIRIHGTNGDDQSRITGLAPEVAIEYHGNGGKDALDLRYTTAGINAKTPSLVDLNQKGTYSGLAVNIDNPANKVQLKSSSGYKSIVSVSNETESTKDPWISTGAQAFKSTIKNYNDFFTESLIQSQDPLSDKIFNSSTYEALAKQHNLPTDATLHDAPKGILRDLFDAR